MRRPTTEKLRRRTLQFAAGRREKKAATRRRWAGYFEAVERSAKLLAVLAIPVIVAVYGNRATSAQQDRGLRRDYVQIAIGILQNKDVDPGLREWAVGLLANNSSAPLPDTLLASLKNGRTTLPATPLPLARVSAAEQPLMSAYAASVSGPFHECPPVGDGGDPFLNLLKNRDKPPAQYTDVTVEQLLANRPAAAETMGKQKRDQWSDAALASVATTERQGVRLSGYLVAVKREGPESCNCHSTSDVDFHLWLVSTATTTREHALLAEISPRELPNHPGWTQERLVQLSNAATLVRVSGWVLWDQEHPEALGKVRGTLWEVHPIHLIEVQTVGGWKSLDDL